MNQQLKKHIRNVPIYILSGFLAAISINGLLVPHQFIGAGIGGVAMLTYYMTGFPVWLFTILGNIPLFLYALKRISLPFCLSSAFCMLMLSFFLWLTDGWVIPVENPIIVALSAGVLSGLGSGLALREGSSLGGIGVLTVILNKKLSFPIGAIDMSINAVILIALGVFTGSIELALLSLVAIYTASLVVDSVQEGFNRRKTILIISNQWGEIAERLSRELNRGVTLLDSEGWYTHTNRKIVYCIIRTMELARLKSIVFSEDPDAFLSVIETREVMAKTFDNKPGSVK
ncbi:MAG: YitT family protein [Christensenellales bacterium]|jgi:uncharacterized membrane-anchored protein YitT (DUF2179 family)